MNMASRVVRILHPLMVAGIALVSASAAQAQLTILPVGDSITRGFSGQPSYRAELMSRLTDAGCSPVLRGSQGSGNLLHEGYSGHEANDFLNNGRAANPGIEVTLSNFSPPADPADVLLLHIGTNDMIVGDSVSSTLTEIDDIIDIIKTDSPNTSIYLANGVPLFVLFDDSGNGRLDTGTDTDGDGFYDISNSAADALAAGIEANYANDPDVTVVDVRTGFRPTDMPDGIHPSEDDPSDPRSDSGEHLLAVAFAAALEAGGDCIPDNSDGSFPLTSILSPLSGDAIDGSVTISGQSIDTGGSGFVRVRLAILDGLRDDFPINCSGCTWWNFDTQEFGSFDSENAILLPPTDPNYLEWEHSSPVNLPVGQFTLFALTIDGDSNQNFFNLESWPERTVFTVTGSSGFCNGLPVTVDLANGDSPTSGDDVIIGTPGADFIDAGAGDDTICGLGGADTIFAGGGADYVEGGDGADQIFGEGGNDIIFGGTGPDEIDGGGGDDEIFGEAGNDTLVGRTGEDMLDGGTEVDSISGGPQADTIFTGPGATVGSGLFVSGGGAADTIFGGPDADDLRGAAGADTIHGEGGDDVITGGIGQDELFGGSGDDTIRGQGSRDDLFGGAGNDDLTGGAGDDDLDGGSGLDSCAGQAGTNDTAVNCESESTIP